MRILFYLGIIGAVALGVFYKRSVIIERRQAPTVSILKEWQKYGKPVEVAEAKIGDLTLLERTTAKVASPQKAIAQVSRSFRPKLSLGAEVYLQNGEETLAGVIQSVSGGPNRLTGLYDVVIRPLKSFEAPKIGQSIVADVAVSKVKKVLRVPVTAIRPAKDGSKIVWKLEGEEVKRIAVKVGRMTAQHAEILAGVKDGDSLVVRGQSLLEEGERVRVVSADLNRGVQ